MARRPKSKAVVGPKAVTRRRKWKLGRTTLATANLVEIGADHYLWNGHSTDLVDMRCEPGDIVKLTPAPGTEESLVASVEKHFYSQSASSVKVMPTQDDVKIVVAGEEFDFADELPDDNRSLRQVALDRAAAVKNSHDQPALEKLVNWAMDRAEAKV